VHRRVLRSFTTRRSSDLDEAGVQPPARIHGKVSEWRGRLGIFLAAEVIVVFHDPAAGHRTPLEIDGLSGRQTIRGRVRDRMVCQTGRAHVSTPVTWPPRM